MKNYYLESRMESKNKTRIIVSIILIIITIIVVAKVNNYNKENYYITQAVVTNVDVAYFSHNDIRYSIIYRYEVNGKEYDGKYIENIKILTPEVGKDIKIKYDKENHSKSKPDLLARYIKFIIMIIISVVIIVISYKIKIKK